MATQRRGSSYWADRREQFNQTETFVSNTSISEARPTCGGGLPDVSKFSTHLGDYINMPLADFEKTFNAKEYVTKLSFNPLDAKYFDIIMDPAKRPPLTHGSRDDFTLSPSQIDLYAKNGFVVGSEESNFGEAYYAIFNNDLPVLITADSILHAFHKSYDSVLEEFETDYGSKALKTIFDGARESIKELSSKFSSNPFKQCFEDADVFLTVAANLLNGEEFYRAGSPKDPKNNKQENNNARYNWYTFYDEPMAQELIIPVLSDGKVVEELLEACMKKQEAKLQLFGKDRTVDFTLFTPRGHYAKSAALRQYFRAVNWLGEIQLIFAGPGSNLLQLGVAVVLHMLLTNNKETEEIFHKYNKTIEALVGHSDSMDMSQFGNLLDSVFKMKSYENLNSEQALVELQKAIIQSGAGTKLYNNTLPEDVTQAFAFLGKKFVLDGWAQSKFVQSDENNLKWQDNKVKRHVTSAVEVAYSVLRNDDAASVIYERMTTPTESKFRDGLIFHPYLVSARKTIDELPEETWSSSIYMYWLNALRKLSNVHDSRFPQAMRTKAYAMKNMNTQLGSWAQLRHDNILYVQQPRRSTTCCDYPAGFVEPFVEFWEAMETLCLAISNVMLYIAPPLSSPDELSDEATYKLNNQQEYVAHFHKKRSYKRVEFFENFAKHARVLRDISVLEVENQPLNAEQTMFLKNVVEKYQTFGSGASTYWEGWYPSLFYGGNPDCINPDLIVCDTFTNSPQLEDGDPGCVVHQALGLPRRMVMAVDNGKDVAAYVGPVFGFYEFELPGIQRMADEEWKQKVIAKQTPPPPSWTASYLVY